MGVNSSSFARDHRMASTSGSFMDHSFNSITALSARRQLHLLSQPLAEVTVGVGVAEVDVWSAGLRLSLAVRPRVAGLAGVWAAAAVRVGPVVTRPLEAGAGWGRGAAHEHRWHSADALIHSDLQ